MSKNSIFRCVNQWVRCHLFSMTFVKIIFAKCRLCCSIISSEVALHKVGVCFLNFIVSKTFVAEVVGNNKFDKTLFQRK